MNSLLFSKKIGVSTLNQSIDLWQFSKKPQADIFILGGVHGDEIEGILIAEAIIRKLLVLNNSKIQNQIYGFGLAVIPKINPDGTLLKQRANYNDVDLNRNLPTLNWTSEATTSRYKPGPIHSSEVETKLFLETVKTINPKIIISLHSFSKTLLLYPTNSVSARWRTHVEKLSTNMGFPVVEEMDYKVFGSLSRFGTENNIATLTIELPRGMEEEALTSTYVEPIWEFICDDY